MTPHHVRLTAEFAAVIGVAAVTAAVWSFYQHPAMGLLLGAIRFCG